ncbi:MAG: HIT domain-containing protein [Elusimicrobiota bacterium]
MPEFRQNIATKEWVIFDTEHPHKPEELRNSAKPAKSPQKECPFCPGAEAKTSGATFVVGGDDAWRIRCFEKKHPVLMQNAPKIKDRHPLYRALPGEGIHEVIVDTPDHEAHLATMPEAQALDLFATYQQRFQTMLHNPHIAMPLLFKNHGNGPDCVTSHEHSQIVGTSVVPLSIRSRMDEATKYYESTGLCVFCKMLEQEMKDQVRVIEENNHFLAFVLYASLSPFHIWILPKRHATSFGDANEKEIADLARIMQKVAKRLDQGLNDPAYNYVIQSTPLDRGDSEAFHWYMTMIVHTTKASGFQLGSGMFTNTVLPEESARYLRDLKI